MRLVEDNTSNISLADVFKQVCTCTWPMPSSVAETNLKIHIKDIRTPQFSLSCPRMFIVAFHCYSSEVSNSCCSQEVMHVKVRDFN